MVFFERVPNRFFFFLYIEIIYRYSTSVQRTSKSNNLSPYQYVIAALLSFVAINFNINIYVPILDKSNMLVYRVDNLKDIKKKKVVHEWYYMLFVKLNRFSKTNLDQLLKRNKFNINLISKMTLVCTALNCNFVLMFKNVQS